MLEETLLNAKQAFAIQLWISRALFIVGIVLFGTFLASLAFFSDNRALTGTSVVSSIVAFAGAAFFNPEQRIGANLANITKLEAILGGYTRQAAVLEEYLYQVMKYYQKTGPEHGHKTVVEGVDKLSSILSTAVRSIHENVESKEQDSPRERWLWDELVKVRDANRPSTGTAENAPGPNGQVSGPPASQGRT